MDVERNLLALALLLVGACGPAERNKNTDAAGDPGLQDAPSVTSLSGKVFAPNGTLPLYNVSVYIPSAEPTPFTPGVQCTKCNTISGALAHTVTDAEGKFRLDNVPTGQGFSIVVETGKWRRKLDMQPVGLCIDNQVPDGMLRLPKNRSEGELPKIALVTGALDDLGCILPKLGIDASEFGSDSNGAQSITFYNGSGGSSPGTPQAAEALWGNLDEMKKFDMIINSCEGSEYPSNKTSPDLLRQYADIGGRVFGSHFHYTWMEDLIPQWNATADWASSGVSSTPDLIDTSHPDGQALAMWLVAVGASTVPGQIDLGDKTPSAGAVGSGTTRWLMSSGNPATTHYMSFRTPVGAMPDNQCGKVVYAGLHVASGSVDTSFPANCGSGMTADEKALVFLLFDLGACVDPIF